MKRSQLTKALLVGAAFGAVCLFHSGCLAVAAGAAGAGAVAYVRGELNATVSARYEPTVRAANRAIEQLGFVKINERKDAFIAVIVARTADDKKVEVRVSQLTAESTKVEIRIGILGDEAKSLAILDRIKSNL